MTSVKTRMQPEEAAAYIGCRNDKILEMVRKKEIPHYRLVRRFFFTRETLDQWVVDTENKSVQPGA